MSTLNMESSVTRGPRERGPLSQLYVTVRRSFLLMVALSGTLVSLAGYLLLQGTLAAFFVIWGVSLVLFGFGIYGLLSLNRTLF